LVSRCHLPTLPVSSADIACRSAGEAKGGSR
jgi:hypothetical protein